MDYFDDIWLANYVCVWLMFTFSTARTRSIRIFDAYIDVGHVWYLKQMSVILNGCTGLVREDRGAR